MPYKIDSFLSAALPEFIESGDTQNIGTGRADVDIVRMPGGQFYDNQGDEDSPRALDTIVKSGMVYATGGVSVRTQVEALRAKLGAKGRLDLLWHDGAQRWIDARFTSIRTPRGFNHALTSLPVDLGFTPIGGFWYADDPTVDGEAWVASTTTDDFEVTNSGNANVTAMVIEYLVPTVETDATVTIENYETSQKITLNASVEPGWKVVLDVGERRVDIHEEDIDIDSIERSGNVLTVEATAHGLIVGNAVVVQGTNYDGHYVVVTAPDANHVTLEADALVKQPHGPQLATGTITATRPIFGDVTFSDKSNWFTLLPGDNTIHVTTTENFNGGAINFTFYATYG